MDVTDLDFINEFDLLPHDSLIKKLALYNINSAHVKWIENCLNDSSKKIVQREQALNGSIFICPLQGLVQSLLLLKSIISNFKEIKSINL